MTNFIYVADMITALSALPADARLVVTQTGYYCYDDFADCFLPRPVDNDNDGTQFFAIGHSHQSY